MCRYGHIGRVIIALPLLAPPGEEAATNTPRAGPPLLSVRLSRRIRASGFLVLTRGAEKNLDLVFGDVIRMRPAPDQMHRLVARRTDRPVVRTEATRLLCWQCLFPNYLTAKRKPIA